MKKLLILLLVIPFLGFSQENKEPSKFKKDLKKTFKFSTFYAAVNGGTSLSDRNTFTVNTGALVSNVIETPFDYSLALGIRKIARFDYENRANVFYDGTESSFSDQANVGKIKGFEFLFEGDYRRIQGVKYLDQHHFIRYVADDWIAKVEYLSSGFVGIEYFEASQRYKRNITKELSINVGSAQRLSEPYGYDPLEEWMLANGNLHYTYLAIQEGYSVNFNGPGNTEYLDPSGNVVASSTAVWEEVIIPQVLENYVEKKKNQADLKLEYSLIFGLDYYKYQKDFWFHAWGNIMPYHVKQNNTFSYHNYNGGQWIDYSGGVIFGYKLNKSLGLFAEGTYNKYWNRNWHKFSMGVNYIIF
jgi:hypothetical protein|tara:strand:- start:3718 stop:4791 length:1074 start_codon:yes stop_codon:yes gene_type:complete